MIHFVNVLQRATGIYLSEEKLYLLETRLSDMMTDHQISSFLDFSKKFENHQEEEFRDQVIERITTHETKFFRDTSMFDAITQRILPEIVERIEERSKDLKDQKIRIWCAACSTGQEPYSIAIAIKERLPHLFDNVRILATDIAKETIVKARTGCYSPFEIGRGLEEYHTDRYFEKAEDGQFKIKDEIKSIVEFEQHNLISPNFPSGFDLVLCRNVSYYFDSKERANLFAKIYKSMNHDSFLIVGSAESISGFSNNFIVREFGLCRYYEINSTSVTLF
nr:protein-glutamate O-methyltransferase CheR [Leptospira fainei]